MDYERQFAEGTELRFHSFVSFSRGSTANEAFIRGSSIVLFCKNVEAFDVAPYSMMRLTRRCDEGEVLCVTPSAFRVSQPPTKTQLTVTVYTEWQGIPHLLSQITDPAQFEVSWPSGRASDGPEVKTVSALVPVSSDSGTSPLCKDTSLRDVEHIVECLTEDILRDASMRLLRRQAMLSFLENGMGASTTIINCGDPAALQCIKKLGPALTRNLILNHPADEHLKALQGIHQYEAVALVNAWACTENTARDVLAAARSTRYVAITAHRELLTIVVGHPQLHSLSVSRCTGLRDMNLRDIAAKCPQLCSLDISCCAKLTDISLKEIATKCPRLESLCVSGCEKLTDGGVKEIAAKCSQLHSLNVAGCKLLSDESVKEIAAKCPHLLSLNVSYCGVTDGCRRDGDCTQLLAAAVIGCQLLQEGGRY